MAVAKKAPMSPLAGPRPGTSITAPIPDEENSPYMATRACASCGITYHHFKSEPTACPLCDAMLRLERAQLALVEARKEADSLGHLNRAMRAQLDILEAIRQAVPMTSDDDLKFIIWMMTTWRDDHSAIAVRITYGRPMDARGNPSANGFLYQMRRNAEMDAYQCVSVGGRAIAGYLDEAMRIVGPPQAMKMLIKSLNQLLDIGE